MRYLGYNRENLAGEWIGVYDEDIQDLLAGHVARMVEMKKCINGLARNQVGKSPPGRPRRSWEVYVKMDVKVIDMDWI
jgi:hypothetical protein